ncbi:mechanosensitive ion channel family protein [Rhodobium gokarnense]|uniref:Small-conductance mechanosensitive channel n=1 Tax=Rhodobium gokarnense TaxID=364296 RepID=A0ABT3HDA1_9HYPH|nr:mechanosensitive ion channel family protein [Rhodobium gokarnense]MCW2308362.1 small-conductance mechanosensitive channel [Rhodobium gokarnense]
MSSFQRSGQRHRSRTARLTGAFGVLIICLFAALPALAADGSSDLAKALAPVLEKARQSGATVIVVEPSTASAAEAAARPERAGPAAQFEAARREMQRIVTETGGLSASIARTIERAGSTETRRWLPHALIVAAIAIAVGELLRRLLDHWGRRQFLRHFAEAPRSRSERVGYLLARAVWMAVAVAFFFGVAIVVASFASGADEATRVTAETAVLGATIVLVAHVVLYNLIVPDRRAYRTPRLPEAAARRLYRDAMIATVLVVAVVAFGRWVAVLGIDEEALKLVVIATTLASAIVLCVLAVLHRRTVAAALYPPAAEGGRATLVSVVARHWYLIAIVYIAVAWLARSVRVLLDLPSADGLVAAPIYAAVGAVALYAVFLLVIDRFLPERPEAAAATGEGADSEDADAEAAAVPDLRAGFKGLIEHGAMILVVIGAFAFVAEVWELDFVDDSGWGNRLVELSIAVFVAYLVYRAAAIWIDHEIAKEEPGAAAVAGEIGGHGGSRLATLLPLFRNFLLISIVVIAAMIVLSELGVDIGPLFAGAGVVGLAVGFGAQTLVRDIFSGAFFLIDDAFRKGEYIDIGSVKGIVEKISIRSFQLRHHNGPLNTVPFGEIKQLTNYSRDWVLMKLPLRVTYDTDVEKVRKLIKQLGEELLEDPDIGHFFLQPLKSQGVNVMEDSAMIIRVKFMTKPGDQFLVKRKVYARIREVFEENGIKFAHREVTVRLADDRDEDAHPLSLAEKEAVAGAVLPAIEEAGKQKKPADDR